MCCCCVSCCWLVVVRRLSWIVVCVFLLFVISWLLGCWLMAVVCSLFVVVVLVVVVLVRCVLCVRCVSLVVGRCCFCLL